LLLRYSRHSARRTHQAEALAAVGNDATPDLSVLAWLLRPQGARAARYIAWVTDNFLPEAPGRFPGFVLNCSVNGFGHRFVYDEDTLALTMRLAGFASITRHAIGESDDPHLRGLEAHTSDLPGDPRLNRELVAFETLDWKATRNVQIAEIGGPCRDRTYDLS